MKILEFIKKYKVDIIIILSLIVISVSSVLTFHFLSTSNNLIAYIYVSNELINKIDLSLEKEEPRYFFIEGTHGELKISVKKDEIKIVESTCPNKSCIYEGAATTLKPIICAYNEVVIEVKDNKINDNNVDTELG